LTEQHREKAVECFAQTFSEAEPMAQCIKTTKEDYIDIGHFYLDNDPNRLSIALVEDVGTDEEIAGYMLSGDYFIPHFELAPKNKALQPVLDLLDILDSKFQVEIAAKGYKQGDIMHLCCLGVADSNKGQGLSHVLVSESIKVAKTKGYKIFVAECTGLGSQTAFSKAGFKTFCEVLYSDFQFNGNACFAELPSKRNLASCKLMIRIDDEKNI